MDEYGLSVMSYKAMLKRLSRSSCKDIVKFIHHGVKIFQDGFGPRVLEDPSRIQAVERDEGGRPQIDTT